MSMPTFEGTPEAMARRFAQVLAGYPEAPVRKTFGSPCAYVNGNMALGLHGSDWFVRLPPEAAAELLDIDGAAPFAPMPGRPMTGYVVLPAAVVDDPIALAGWLERSLAFAATLPPKVPKSR